MDFPIWIFLIIGFLLVLGLVLKGGETKGTYSYSLIPTLLSPAERSFFGVLNQAVGDTALVFAKVRVADILKPEKGMNRSNWQRAFNRISSKHFDFVLCKKDDVSIICVIELNDSSHQSKKRQVRDEFLRGVCESASLSLIEISAKRAYNVKEIGNQLSLLINASK